MVFRKITYVGSNDTFKLFIITKRRFILYLILKYTNDYIKETKNYLFS